MSFFSHFLLDIFTVAAAGNNSAVMMGQCVQHGRQEKPDNTCRLEVDVAGGDVIHLDDDGVCYVGQTSSYRIHSWNIKKIFEMLYYTFDKIR